MSPEHTIWNKNYTLLAFNSFFIFLNYYMLAATMPSYIKGAWQTNAVQMGLITSVFVLGNVSFRPFSGMIAERYGRKKIIVSFACVFLSCSLLYFYAQTIVSLLLIRFFHGMSFAMITTSAAGTAYASVNEQQKTKAVGYYSLFMSLAMVSGPAIGISLTDHLSFQYVLIGSSLASVLALCLAIPVKIRNDQPVKMTLKNLRFSSLFEPDIIPVCLAAFFVAFSYSSLITFIPDYTRSVGLGDHALLFLLLFSLFIIVPRPFILRWHKQFGDDKVVYSGLVLFASGLLLLNYTGSWKGLAFSGMILGMSYGALFPVLQAIAIRKIPAERMGIAVATFFWLFDIGFGAGTYCLAYILNVSGYTTMYYAAVLACAASAAFYFIFIKKERKKYIS